MIKFKGIRIDTKETIEGNAFFGKEKTWIAPDQPEDKKALGGNPHISNFYEVEQVEAFINGAWTALNS